MRPEIISKSELKCVFILEQVNPTVDWVFTQLMNSSTEVLYFETNNKLRAVISFGDFFRYFEEKKDSLLNTSFTVIHEENEDKAFAFIQKHPTIHELPVINDEGEFVGIWNCGIQRSQKEQNSFRSYAENLYFRLDDYWERVCEKLMISCNASVCILELPQEDIVLKKLNRKHQIEFYNKAAQSDLDILWEMTEEESHIYWGDEYYENISRDFAESFSDKRMYLKNGTAHYDINSNPFFKFEHGHRVVENSPDNPNGRIILVGPCTVIGAYVTDRQTIEYYLQNAVNSAGLKYEVVNWGNFGINCEFQYLLTEPIGENDIVIIATGDRILHSILEKNEKVHNLGETSSIFEELDDPISCVLDTFRHVNYKVNQLIAERIYERIKPYLRQKTIANPKIVPPIQNYFISWDICKYYKQFALKN